MQLLRENLIEYVFSSAFGILVTILLFYLTSQPTTGAVIRRRLTFSVLKRLQKELRRSESAVPMVTNFLAQEFDIHSLKSILMFGIWEPKNSAAEWYRWIAVFEPKEPRLIDRLVGRPGLYDLVWFGHMAIPCPDSLAPAKLEVVDFDGDGVPEVHATLTSTWGDSASIGPLILKKTQSNGWRATALPSISALTSNVLQGKSPHPNGVDPPGRPFSYFGMNDTSAEDAIPPAQDLRKARVYEDNWTLVQNGMGMQFATLRNGGTYQFRKHPVRGHVQVATLAFFVDGRATLSTHYAIVSFFALDSEKMMSDLFWNWGFPMVSMIPLRPSDIDLDSIGMAGVKAHIIGNTFFGYTGFERSVIDQQDSGGIG